MTPQTGDALRVLPMVFWAVSVVIGVIYLTQHGDGSADRPVIKSDRDLPQNTLLMSDMLVTDLTGHYLIKSGGVKVGEGIRSQDVGDAPILPEAASARFLVVISVPISSVGPINAGSKVQLCADPPVAAAVLYVHCSGDKLKPACAATVEVPKDSLKSFADHAGAIKVLQSSDSCS